MPRAFAASVDRIVVSVHMFPSNAAARIHEDGYPRIEARARSWPSRRDTSLPSAVSREGVERRSCPGGIGRARRRAARPCRSPSRVSSIANSPATAPFGAFVSSESALIMDVRGAPGVAGARVQQKQRRRHGFSRRRISLVPRARDELPRRARARRPSRVYPLFVSFRHAALSTLSGTQQLRRAAREGRPPASPSTRRNSSSREALARPNEKPCTARSSPARSPACRSRTRPRRCQRTSSPSRAGC